MSAAFFWFASHNGDFGALGRTFPDSVLAFAKLHNRIRESEIVMEEMGDVFDRPL